MSKQIGEKIRHLRKKLHLTQEELSARVDYKITRSTISNYEIGRRTPHLEHLMLLAGALGVGLDFFYSSSQSDEYNLLARAHGVFESDDVKQQIKDDLYLEISNIYIQGKMKRDGA